MNESDLPVLLQDPQTLNIARMLVLSRLADTSQQPPIDIAQYEQVLAALSQPDLFADTTVRDAFLRIVGPGSLGLLNGSRRFALEAPELLQSAAREVDPPFFSSAHRESATAIPLGMTMLLSRRTVSRISTDQVKISGEGLPEMIVDEASILSAMKQLRQIDRVVQSLGLRLNPMRQIMIDLSTGTIWAKNGGLAMLSSVSTTDDAKSTIPIPFTWYDAYGLRAPHIGRRLYGEDLLGEVARKCLLTLASESQGADLLNEKSAHECIEGLIDTYREHDALPSIEEILNGMMREGSISVVRRAHALDSYRDYLFSHAYRRLQLLMGIDPRIDAGSTVRDVMRSLDECAKMDFVPPELWFENDPRTIFLEAKQTFADLMKDERMRPRVYGLMREYLRRNGVDGLPWFAGAALPLIAGAGGSERFAYHSMQVLSSFDPHMNFGWASYGSFAGWVYKTIGVGPKLHT